MKPLKIVLLSTPGSADCDLTLVREFQRLGHDAYFFMLLAKYNQHTTVIDIDKLYPINDIIPANKYVELQKFSSFLDINKMFVINKMYKQDSHPCSLYLYWKLSQRIKDINPDIIVTKPFTLAGLILYKFRDNTLFVIHDPFLHSGENFLRERFFRWICFRLGRKFVILNPNQRDEFCKRHRINPKKVMVNSLGTYDVLKIFLNKSIRQPIKSNILFFGRISPYKGIEYLCKAMEIVHRSIPEATLTIVGNGLIYFDSSLYKNKNYIKMENRFVSTEELLAFIKQSTIICCPYTDATQSGVVMTSFTFHKPVVATRVGGLENQIEDGDTGILVPPRNVCALADALIKVLGDSTFIQKMKKNINLKYKRGDYSWNVIAKKYICFANPNHKKDID